MRRQWLIVMLVTLAVTPFLFGDDAAFRAAQEAYRKEDFKAAKEQATVAVKDEPKRVEARVLLGMACGQLRDHAGAVEAFSGALAIDPKMVFAYDRRGDASLKLGKFTEAIKDFDKVLELNPEFAPEHWRRGIALYYAGRFADGAKQFETHKKANPEDVENAAWHFLCNAKVIGVAKAREQLITVTKDPRIPMAQIQLMFAGQMKPEQVLAAAEAVKAESEASKEAKFYANLYVGLYYEAEGNAAKAKEHLTTAVEKHKISHYMWDVGFAHVEMLKAKK
jgi:lipoprotein NlpI